MTVSGVSKNSEKNSYCKSTGWVLIISATRSSGCRLVFHSRYTRIHSTAVARHFGHSTSRLAHDWHTHWWPHGTNAWLAGASRHTTHSEAVGSGTAQGAQGAHAAEEAAATFAVAAIAAGAAVAGATAASGGVAVAAVTALVAGVEGGDGRDLARVYAQSDPKVLRAARSICSGQASTKVAREGASAEAATAAAGASRCAACERGCR